jgi:branched-chain amino acid transport system ATP-binding protein
LAAVTLLSTRGLSRHFGGLNAVERVDLAIERGEIRAIIGPNGAGKTTLVGVICGRISPSAGRITFEDQDITHLSAWRRVALGIAYTFQVTSVFANLTCFDNVALAVQHRKNPGSSRAPLLDEIMHQLERVGLQHRAQALAATLPYGHQRLLELALGLALHPKLLILDEPTQGLSDAEIAGFCALVRDIAGDTTVLLIEHNMPVVMDLAHRITVMENGRILAEGSPHEIRHDTEVQVLRDLSLGVQRGEILCLLGRNGAGKTTALKTMMGLIKPRSGQIFLGERELTRLPPHEFPKLGIAYVPQGRRLFSELTVAENLTIGLMARRQADDVRERVLNVFPALKARLDQISGTLSGGEQEMLAVARALCLDPQVLLLDEPTEGLMPSMIQAVLTVIRQLKENGVAVVLVEQRVESALSVADRVAFLENGVLRAITTPEAVHQDPAALQHYVGVGLSQS